MLGSHDVDLDEYRHALAVIISQAATGRRASHEIKTLLRMLGPASFNLLVERERDSISWPFVVAEHRARVGCFSGDWTCELSAPGRFCISAPMLNGLAFVRWVELGEAEARAS